MAQRTRRRYELREPKLDQMLENLVEEAENLYAGSDSAEYVRQIMVSALGLMRDGASRGDLKLIHSALKELRHSFRVFAPYRHLRKVAIFGSARMRAGRRSGGVMIPPETTILMPSSTVMSSTTRSFSGTNRR